MPSYSGYQLTNKAEQVIKEANAQRQRVGQSQIGTDHVLCGLATVADTVARAALVEHGVTAAKLTSLDSHANTTPPAVLADPNDHTQNLLGRADTIRAAYGDSLVGPEHLLLALVSPKFGDVSASGYTRLTQNLDVSPTTVAASVVRLLNRDPVLVGLPAAPPPAPVVVPEPDKPEPVTTVTERIYAASEAFIAQVQKLLVPRPVVEPPLSADRVLELIKRESDAAVLTAVGPPVTVDDDVMADLQASLEAAQKVLGGLQSTIHRVAKAVATMRRPSV